ncbi:hypothetical protein VFPPC_16253 [Pochonia chlamydosporia 170]|uniref:Uncharacterized protein n=1 Tax=Pochonia chlamydosporia 170 TaxID=1380566 RepID=A0A179FGQ2_METCM|nr:hypothetical protein VFPPC_16253 [Pochonia chlamydosporia 170]OAQ64775.1 hypothetical protein VFPPC_16253 [Pochonia chlamydosporia 170]
MKSIASIIAACAFASLAAADTIYVQNDLGCETSVRGNIVKLACFKAMFTDGGGKQFTSDCGFSNVPGACNGMWQNQKKTLDLGGGYQFTSDGTNAFVKSANGKYNAKCVPSAEKIGKSCTLSGDTDSSS